MRAFKEQIRLRRGHVQILAQVLTTAVGIFAFYIGIAPLMLIHELGHFVAGYACGFRLIEFRVGPIEMIRPDIFHSEEPVRYEWHWKLRYWGTGRILMHADPVALVRTRMRDAIYTLGGPVSTLGSAVLVLPIAMQDTMAGGIAKYFVLVSVLLGVGNLIPFSKYGVTSDGGHLWALLFDEPGRNQRLFYLTLFARLKQIHDLESDGEWALATAEVDSLIVLIDELPAGSVDSGMRGRMWALRERFARMLTAQTGSEAADK